MSDEEVKVGNINKATKKPLPNKASKVEEPAGEEGIEELNAKMTKLIELAQAIDWKMWVYLKANNYID